MIESISNVLTNFLEKTYIVVIYCFNLKVVKMIRINMSKTFY